MPDIAIVWSPLNGTGDWGVGAGDLLMAASIESAVLVSLMTDRVLGPGETPPQGQSERRGWWADTYEGTPIGSRLWTLSRVPISDRPKLVLQARDICREALQWLLDDGIAATINIAPVFLSPTLLGLPIKITEPDGTVTVFNYSWSWEGSF